jgi:hypothetical protein
MNSYRYKISLRVRHPSMDPAEITCMLRYPPSRSWSAHERRSTPSSETLEGAWPETYWTAKVTAGEWPGKDLPAAIAELLDQLESSRGFLAKIRSEGGAVELFVGWFFDGQSGEVFDCGLLARIADLKIDLSLDVYPPDTTPVNLPIYKTIALPDGKSRILLFDSPAGSGGRLENLVCVDHEGALIWTAQLPKDTLPDAFLSARMEGAVIVANTWSCFAVTIDPRTGKTLGCAFTK